MKHISRMTLTTLTSLVLIGTVSPTFAVELRPKREEPPVLTKGQAVDGQLLVKFKNAPTITYESEIALTIPFIRKTVTLREAGFAVKGNRSVTAINKRLKVKAMRVLGQGDPGKQVALVQLPTESDERGAIEQYKKTGSVEFAEPNYLVRPQFVPNDPYFQRTTGQDYQWNFHEIKMPQAWDIPPQGGSPSVKVVVIDTGVAFATHTLHDQPFVRAPELTGVNFVAPKRFESLSPDCETPLPVPIVDDHPHDLSGHGTHETATMVQAFNNGAHAAGIAPNISIVPIKALTHCTSGPDAGNDVGTLADILAAITHGVGATSGETAVFNMSFGMDGSPLSLVFAFIALDSISRDVVVAASGNGATRTSSPPVLIPAAFPYGNVIGVGATRFDGRRAEYSQYGSIPAYPEQSAVDLVAPGGQMWADSGPLLDACRAAATTLQQELACLLLDQNSDTVPDGIVQQTIVPGNQTQFTSIGAPQFGFRCLEIDTTAQTVGIDQSCGLYNGTSMAAPHVSAAAALMLSVNPNLTHHEVRDLLVSTASKTAIPGYTQTEHGAGLLDVAAALAAASGGTGTPTPTVTPGGPSLTPTPTATRIMTFELHGGEQVPPVTTTAYGDGFITVNTNTNSLEYSVDYALLSSLETAAHIHGPAPRGSNASSIHTLPSGTTKVGTWIYPESLESAILSGQMYINVHSQHFPDGEIRGQIDGPAPVNLNPPQCGHPSIPPETGPAPLIVTLHGAGDAGSGPGFDGYRWDPSNSGVWSSPVSLDPYTNTYGSPGVYHPKFQVHGINHVWSAPCNYPYEIVVQSSGTPTPRPSGWTTTEPFQLLVGDVNDSNTISIEDLSAVLSTYTDFKIPVAAGIPEDVNADGYVTIEDIALVLLNYNDFTVPGDTP